MASSRAMRSGELRAPTARQTEVLGAIEAHRAALGYSPGVRDLCRLLGVSSTNSVAGHLKALAAKGLLDRTAKVARTWQATELGLRFLGGGL